MISAPFDTECPHCGRVNTHVAYFETGEEPRPIAIGDTGFCAGCGQFAKYDGEKMRKATIEEEGEFTTDRECVALKALWSLYYTQRQKANN